MSVLDSPVTGAVDGARNGRLTLLVGGDEATVDRMEPILSHLGLVIRCGGLGTGNVVKLVTNQLWFIAAAAIGEGFAIGVGNGVELGTLWHAIKERRRQLRCSTRRTVDLRRSLRPVVQPRSVPKGSRPHQRAGRPGARRAAHDHRCDRQKLNIAIDRYGAQAAELHVARRIEDDASLSFRLDGDWTPPWEQ